MNYFLPELSFIEIEILLKKLNKIKSPLPPEQKNDHRIDF